MPSQLPQNQGGNAGGKFYLKVTSVQEQEPKTDKSPQYSLKVQVLKTD